jgi:hypothetical protein
METNKRVRKTAEEQLSEAQAKVNKLKAVMSKQNRAAETRKKVLAGAAILSVWNKSTDEKTKRYLYKVIQDNLDAKDFEYLGLELPAIAVFTAAKNGNGEQQ